MAPDNYLDRIGELLQGFSDRHYLHKDLKRLLHPLFCLLLVYFIRNKNKELSDSKRQFSRAFFLSQNGGFHGWRYVYLIV
jgi:hypothetical protein